MSIDIGFVGLGAMGLPMAANLLAAGHRVTVWNRTASKGEPLAAKGAVVATRAGDTARRGGMLVSMVADDAALEELVMGEAAVAERLGGGADWWRRVGSRAMVTDEIADIVERFRLGDVMYERTAILPYGKQRLLEIALAFACRPRVLLLDEPAAGVPEAERYELLATIAALPADVTVLLIEHDMDLVFSFADRISVLVNGALFVEGAPTDVARDPRVKAVYLGEELDG